MPSDKLPALLNSVAEAIRANDFDTAETRLTEVETVYNEIDAPERIKQRQVTVGRDRTEIDSNTRKRLDEFAQAVNASDLGRFALLTATTTYLSAPTQTDANEIANKLEQQAEQEETLLNLEEPADAALDSLTLAPTLVIPEVTTPDGVQSKGSSFDISIIARNVGDEPAENVEVTLDSEAGINPESVSLGLIESNSEKSNTFTVAANRSGEFTVTLRIEGEPGQGAERTERFRIVDKVTAIKRAKDSIEDLIKIIDESDQLTGGKENSAISKLEDANAKLEDSLRFADQGNTKQANNMLKAASRIVGAFLNSIEGIIDDSQNGSENGREMEPTAAFTRTIKTLAEGIIDQISLARQAEI